MATLKSIATGNFTSASTWALCNSTAELDSELNSTNSTTSYVASSGFTPGAITIQAICVKFSARVASPTGTVSIELFNNTLAASVAGTEVTLNVTDLESGILAADQRQGWVSFKFASSVTLLAANVYSVRFKTSATSSCALYRDATAGNWSRQLVTTTTQAPAAGDKLIMIGEKTGAGASTSYTITMDNTATTNFGTNSTTVPSVSIGHNATVTYGVASATNYYFKINGSLVIQSGGTLNIGTTGTPIPRDSTAVLEIDVGGTTGNHGIEVRGTGIFNAQGLSRTSGKLIHRCMLNTDEAIASTSLGVDTDTGWLSGDQIVIAGTAAATNQSETRTLSADAGASTITISSGLTNAHSGTDPVLAAEVVLLTRNVIIRSSSSSFSTYIRTRNGAMLDFDWVALHYVGGTVTNKRGLEFQHTATDSGSANIKDCVLFSGAGIMLSCGTTSTANITVEDTNVTGATGISSTNGMIHIGSAPPDFSIVFDGVWAINSSAYCYSSASSVKPSLIDCRSVNGTVGFYLQESSTTASTATVSNLIAKCNSSTGFSIGSSSDLTINGFTASRNGTGVSVVARDNTVLKTGLIRGNTTQGIQLESAAGTRFYDCTVSGYTGFTQPIGLIVVNGASSFAELYDVTFGVVTGSNTAHTTSDFRMTAVNSSTITQIKMRNCNLASSSEFTNTGGLSLNSAVISERHDQTSNQLTIWYYPGIVTKDTTISATASPSYRLTPNTASYKLGHTILRAAVAAGTTATVSVKVRESVVGDGTDYNGARPRLIVKQNNLAGITSDTVLATATVASEGAFETLTGTTATVTNACVLEFCVDCDGTTGWVNVDDITAPTAVNSLELAATDETLPWSAVGNNSSGSSGTIGFAFAN